MKNFKNVLIIFLFFSVLFFLIERKIEEPKNIEDIKFVEIANKKINVELALTKIEQEQGLSGRKELDVDRGMLFVFSQTGIYPFWMKDMNFPIDMIWVGEDLKVVYIAQEIKPESYPKVFSSIQKAKYVLEVNAGFSRKNNLKVGDSVVFTY